MTIPEACAVLEREAVEQVLEATDAFYQAMTMAMTALARVAESRREVARGLARKLPGETLVSPGE